MNWITQPEIEYCLFDNPKGCPTTNKCCYFCKKKNCEWRCADNPKTCKYITDEVRESLTISVTTKPTKKKDKGAKKPELTEETRKDKLIIPKIKKSKRHKRHLI